MICGTRVKRLQVIPDDRGWQMAILRSDDELFLNRPTELYNKKAPGELRLDPPSAEVPYDWATKMR